ncbi:probable phytol kinase 2, chloroplastic [Coffea arabica]|uniref:Probable phytol kinase 2, chloroplastic n=1 Tax=Coffea arabica TaxID=13443 RepID=A0ABM4WV74_COFAR
MAAAAASITAVIYLSFNRVNPNSPTDLRPQQLRRSFSANILRATRVCPVSSSSSPAIAVCNTLTKFRFGFPYRRISPRFRSARAAALPMFSENPVVGDVVAAALTGGIALSMLRFWGEIAKMGVLDQKLNRKLVHVSIGLVFMLCWPMFSSGSRGAVLAALIPGVNIIKVLLLGLGVYEDEATVKSMSRFGDHRELLKGPLYYATTITLACALCWRTSPIAIAAICNLCAGDGLADIMGRRFGSKKLPYNKNKSIVGTFSMVVAGFLASIGYMHYFSTFGYVEESWQMAYRFFVVSLVAALVESHPISTELDDNLTVPLTSVLVGSFVF